VRGHPLEVPRGVRGVDHDQEVVGREAVDQQVVDVGAELGEEPGVVGPARRELRHVVGGQALEQRLGARAAHPDLAHVRDIEEAGGGAHRLVLLDDAGVLDRHLPAGERHQAAARLDVAFMKRRSPQVLGALTVLGHRRDPPGGGTRPASGRNAITGGRFCHWTRNAVFLAPS
jgi:hypothetical protein